MPSETPADPTPLLRTSREHAVWSIQLADFKANVLMASSAILAGLLVQQSIPVCNDPARYAVIVAVGLALSSAGAALLTVYPRTTSEQRDTLLWYRAAMQFARWEEYYARVKDLTAADLNRELSGQIWELARIQARKFTWLRRGFVLFGLCLIATFVGVVWAHLPCA